MTPPSQGGDDRFESGTEYVPYREGICEEVPIWDFDEFDVFMSEPESILVKEEMGDVPPLN